MQVKKMGKILAITAILVMLFSVPVYARGRGGGGRGMQAAAVEFCWEYWDAAADQRPDEWRGFCWAYWDADANWDEWVPGGAWCLRYAEDYENFDWHVRGGFGCPRWENPDFEPGYFWGCRREGGGFNRPGNGRGWGRHWR